MKAIGANFFNELKAAGLDDLPISWSENGEIVFGEAVTAKQKADVLAVYEAHNPAKPEDLDTKKALAQSNIAMIEGIDMIFDLLRLKGIITNSDIDAKMRQLLKDRDTLRKASK